MISDQKSLCRQARRLFILARLSRGGRVHLAISREKKEQLVAQYAGLLSSSQVAIWTDHSGLTVSRLSDLRNQLRRQGAEIHVTKNTLLRRAIEECDLPMPEEYMTGPTSIAFLGEAIAGPARAPPLLCRLSADPQYLQRPNHRRTTNPRLRVPG